MKKIEIQDNCPLNNFEPCLETKCAWYTQIRGTNPNTGEDVDHWGCCVTWLPMLLIENSQQQRQTGAAVESFRNEMVKSNEVSQQVLLAAVTSNNPNTKFIEVQS